VIRRRDSLPATLDEIERGILEGVAVVVVNRHWWEALPLGERTTLRARCEQLGVQLRSDDRLSRHFVELGDDPDGVSLSSEHDL